MRTLGPLKVLTIFVLAAALSAAALARPLLFSAHYAAKMRTLIANNTFNELNDLRDYPETFKDVESALWRIQTYLQKGSTVDTRPDALLKELTLYCNTPENPSTTPEIVCLCKIYKLYYDDFPGKVALHEQVLGILAEGLSEGLERFEAANNPAQTESPIDKEKPLPPETNSLGLSLGSGFIISSDGYILTNNHVIAQSARIAVSVSGRKPSEAPVVVSDSHKDLALLKLPLSGLPHLPIADSDLVHVLDTVYVLGYPLAPVLGSTISASEGRINAIRSEGQTKLFQFDADVNPGNSGGPLLNDKGEVIGIVVGKLDAKKMLEEHGSLPERINFAIPINVARQMIRNACQLASTPSSSREVLSSSTIFDNAKGATVLIAATEGK